MKSTVQYMAIKHAVARFYQINVGIMQFKYFKTYASIA